MPALFRPRGQPKRTNGFSNAPNLLFLRVYERRGHAARNRGRESSRRFYQRDSGPRRVGLLNAPDGCAKLYRQLDDNLAMRESRGGDSSEIPSNRTDEEFRGIFGTRSVEMRSKKERSLPLQRRKRGGKNLEEINRRRRRTRKQKWQNDMQKRLRASKGKERERERTARQNAVASA